VGSAHDLEVIDGLGEQLEGKLQDRYALPRIGPRRKLRLGVMHLMLEARMHWSTPILVEICIGLEINSYLPAEL
jgi:coenzyme PQQ precursor peptide PqqA